MSVYLIAGLLTVMALCGRAESIVLECEQFKDLGGWKVDSQFIDEMGSSYLIAHGLGKPVADATTTFEVKKAGRYNVFVRTKNWTAKWVEKKVEKVGGGGEGNAAGRFNLVVNGVTLPTLLGVQGKGEWLWVKADSVTLKAGANTLALHDVSGFDGRCDAICFSTEIATASTAIRPDNPTIHQSDNQTIQQSNNPTISSDLVVVGGGIAGICTAISAARLGLKVALVQDRPLLGGANSSEVRVHLGGYMNLGPYPRLGDIVAEIGPAKGGNAQPAERYEDDRKLAAVKAEKNIELYLNTRVVAVERADPGTNGTTGTNGTADLRIGGVVGRDVVTGKLTRFEAPLFADCTGDGCVGYLAGADYRLGRESKAETGEDMAPEKGDKMTMGASCQWYAERKVEKWKSGEVEKWKSGEVEKCKTNHSTVPPFHFSTSFPSEPWMIKFNEEAVDYALRGDWNWETGMNRDQLKDFETVRDYGMLVAYSNWNHVKNVGKRKAEFADAELAWVAYVAGKRETRRLMGDHILCQQDVFEERSHPDGTCCTTWAIDLHYPMPANQRNYDGEPFRSVCTHNTHHAYPIPYRCFYSRNVPNLFMAGRDISVTHVALGTTRVMRTHGMMGEVVGMAASICKKHNCNPRGVYTDHLGELKALMTKGVGLGKPQPPQNYNEGCMKKRPQVVDLEKDLWFFTDFDGRAQLNGRAVTLKTSPDGETEGRYGKGCYFHRPIRNTLPPMDAFLTAKTNFTVTGGTIACDAAKKRLSLSGGTLTIAPQADPLVYSWVHPHGGVTCSFYVRGAKGTTVTLTPSLSPPPSETVKAAVKKHKDKGFAPDKQKPDIVVASTNVMDGTWRRVWAGVRHDCRTTAGRQIALTVAATGPIEMERFQYEQSSVFPYIGNLVPALWTEGGTSRISEAASIKDPQLLKDFPTERGSASFWVRSVSNDWSYASCRAFAFTDSPKLEYSYDGEFRPGAWANRVIPPAKARPQRSARWQHVAVTWAPSNQCVYIDGELRHNTHYGFTPGKAEGKRRCLNVGTATNGAQPCDAILDEVAIYRRDLTAGEVAALARREKGLLADSRTLLATEIDFPYFWRNQPDAALRCRVRATEPVEVTLMGEVGGKQLPPRNLQLAAGENALAVSFDPSRYRPGTYAWSFALKASDGTVGLVRSGELEIFGRFDREAPTYVSWGGNKPVPNDFLVLAGMNAKNVSSTDLPAVRELVRLGIVPNIRYENSGKWKAYDFDSAAIERDAEASLAPYAGLFLWNQTLVNSEVYGTWVIHEAKKNPKFLARAEKAVGLKPDFTFGDAPSQVRWKDLGLKAPRGLIGPTNATLETLRWCIDRGQPVYQINAANRRAIHRLSPGNVVWTEPVYGSGDISEDVDMMADWYYSYSVDDNLMGQRCNAAQLRGRDKPFMPTLSMYTGAPGRHPTRVGKDGKPEKVTMGQGLDELVVKTHVAIGATRADRLSMFSADSWSEGLKGYAAYSLDATNKVSVICDPDAPKRYGEFVRTTAMPEIRLLRGLENVRAPVAFLQPAETDLAGGHGWIHWHFTRAMRKAVAEQAVPYDVIGDREMKDAAALAKYPCLIFPMASVVSVEHDKVLNEVARLGSTIVIDSYATNTYPNCVKVSSCYKNHPGLLPKTAGGPLLDWYTNRIDGLRAKLTSFSSCDGGNGYTFEKAGNGVRYVMVVNDRRRERSEGGGVLLEFCTNSWYRPYCAPQRIVTTVRNVPEKAGLYLFNGDIDAVKEKSEGTMRTLTAEYGPAEARVFVITPERLEAPELTVEKSDAANVRTVKVRIVTESGKPAPNRTVLRVRVTDPDGRETDECGDYECVGGHCEIPVRLADGDPKSGFFSRWKVVVTDLVTGERDSVGF